jgi:acyl-CoA thioesterase
MNVPPESWKGTFGERLGISYTEVEPGSSRAVLEVRDEHLNPHGVCHGGVLFTFADDSMGAALYSLSPEGFHP